MFDEGRPNRGIFPPQRVRRSALQVENVEPPYDIGKLIEESCSSLVITGDQHGYFWICSAWSSLTSDENLSKVLAKVPTILQTFLYQQASGRNLIFLILLGHLCEKLNESYLEVLDDLGKFVGLGVSPLRRMILNIY
jgi:hypothetical protein